MNYASSRSIQFLKCYLLPGEGSPQRGDHSLVSESQPRCLSEISDSSLLMQNGPAYCQAVNRLEYVASGTIQLHVLIHFSHIPRLLNGKE